jgi:hypothetical protein
MSGKWGIKTEEGYVNFIHGSVDEVWDFETSTSIDDVCIFNETVAKRYASSLQSTAFPIYTSETPRLTKRDLAVLSAYTGYIFSLMIKKYLKNFTNFQKKISWNYTKDYFVKAREVEGKEECLWECTRI